MKKVLTDGTSILALILISLDLLDYVASDNQRLFPVPSFGKFDSNIVWKTVSIH